MPVLSPLDGRYSSSVASLAKVFGPEALAKNRLEVEVEYLLALTELSSLGISKVSLASKRKLKAIATGFSASDFRKIKAIEAEVQHDVKAVEYFVRRQCRRLGLGRLVPWVHFGLTSEDVNNLAQTLQLRSGSRLLLSEGKWLQTKLVALIESGQSAVMLARTHGQPAIPTTMGKELLVFALQMQELLEKLRDFGYRGKLAGAVGTLAAHQLAYPQVNWLAFSKKFVRSFGLVPELVNTQVLLPTSWVELFSLLRRVGLVLTSLAQDLWWYLALGHFKQRPVAKRVGSSTMPQKVNPIELENAEGNGQLAASLFSFFVDKFSHSRLQRDLSDSTVRRNFGVGYGHLLLAMVSLRQGLAKLELARERMRRQVKNHPEVMAEAVQTLLRAGGRGDAYEIAKDFFRGEKFDRGWFLKWLDKLNLPRRVEVKLGELDVLEYKGVAELLTKQALPWLKQRINKLV